MKNGSRKRNLWPYHVFYIFVSNRMPSMLLARCYCCYQTIAYSQTQIIRCVGGCDICGGHYAGMMVATMERLRWERTKWNPHQSGEMDTRTERQTKTRNHCLPFEMSSILQWHIDMSALMLNSLHMLMLLAAREPAIFERIIRRLCRVQHEDINFQWGSVAPCIAETLVINGR